MYYRRLPQFEYVGPRTLEETTAFLSAHQGESRVMAGGTIVLHRMKERIGLKKYLVSLKAVPELDAINGNSSQLKIGAMAHLESVAEARAVKKGCAMLALACSKLGTPQIRAMGTIGGNLACNFATAEVAPVLIALEAQAEIPSAKGTRMVPVENLYKELKEGDILTSVLLPAAKELKYGYEKWAVRERFDYATVAAAVAMNVTGRTCKNVRIGLGGVTLQTRRARRAEETLEGRALNEKLIDQAASVAAKDARTGADIHFSAEYKQELLTVMVRRALTQALKGGTT